MQDRKGLYYGYIWDVSSIGQGCIMVYLRCGQDGTGLYNGYIWDVGKIGQGCIMVISGVCAG